MVIVSVNSKLLRLSQKQRTTNLSTMEDLIFFCFFLLNKIKVNHQFDFRKKFVNNNSRNVDLLPVRSCSRIRTLLLVVIPTNNCLFTSVIFFFCSHSYMSRKASRKNLPVISSGFKKTFEVTNHCYQFCDICLQIR